MNGESRLFQGVIKPEMKRAACLALTTSEDPVVREFGEVMVAIFDVAASASETDPAKVMEKYRVPLHEILAASPLGDWEAAGARAYAFGKQLSFTIAAFSEMVRTVVGLDPMRFRVQNHASR